MHAIIRKAFVDELLKIAGIPPKLLLNPKFEPYFSRVAKGGKDAPKLFPGGPPVHIPGVSPTKQMVSLRPQVSAQL
jgi:hypothetical protein